MPPNLANAAVIVGNGESFWPASVTLRVATWLAECGYAIIGVEAYEATPHAKAIFLTDRRASPEPRVTSAWGPYVEDTYRDAAAFIARTVAEWEGARRTADLLFFLATAPALEWNGSAVHIAPPGPIQR